MRVKLITIFISIGLFFNLLCAQEIDVMTYNIKYANENDGVNSWSQRKADLSAQIRYYAPEILGMQEVLKEQRDFLLDEIPAYRSVGVGRDDGRDKGEFSPIFYLSEKLNLLESGTFWLSESPQIPGKGWDAAFPRICTYAKFSLKDNPQKQFWVFNTHFDHVGKLARQNALLLIQEKIKTFNSQNLPFILMGDLNLPDDASEISTFTQNMQNDFPGFADAYFTRHYGISATYNAYTFVAEMPRIDYDFTFGFNVVKHRIIADRRPNGLWYSDHFPVSARLEFEK